MTIRLGTGSTPSSREVDDAMSQVEGFPPSAPPSGGAAAPTDFHKHGVVHFLPFRVRRSRGHAASQAPEGEAGGPVVFRKVQMSVAMNQQAGGRA